MKLLSLFLVFFIGGCAKQLPTLEPGRQTIVDFSDNASPFEVLRLVNSLDLPLRPNSDMFIYSKIMVADHRLSENSLEALLQSGLVDRIESDNPVRVPDETFIRQVNQLSLDDAPVNDPLFHKQWNFQMVGAPAAWEDSRGANVLVAVLDTGLTEVPDLDSTCILPGKNFTDEGEESDLTDWAGHGTHVIGTIAQSTNNGIGVAGVAHHSCILPVKVLSQNGGSEADIADGLYFAMLSGASVVNLSLGSSHPSPTIQAAVEKLAENNVFLACAAGNDSKAVLNYPAGHKGCHAVSALGPDRKMAFYSSHGVSTQGQALFAAAPGGDIRNFGPDGGVLQGSIVDGELDYFSFQGTSMAAPHVAGIAALVISSLIDHDGDYKLSEVEDILTETAEDIGPELNFGAGLIKADDAVSHADHHWLVRAFK